MISAITSRSRCCPRSSRRRFHLLDPAMAPLVHQQASQRVRIVQFSSQEPEIDTDAGLRRRSSSVFRGVPQPNICVPFSKFTKALAFHTSPTVSLLDGRNRAPCSLMDGERLAALQDITWLANASEFEPGNRDRELNGGLSLCTSYVPSLAGSTAWYMSSSVLAPRIPLPFVTAVLAYPRADAGRR